MIEYQEIKQLKAFNNNQQQSAIILPSRLDQTEKHLMAHNWPIDLQFMIIRNLSILAHLNECFKGIRLSCINYFVNPLMSACKSCGIYLWHIIRGNSCCVTVMFQSHRFNGSAKCSQTSNAKLIKIMKLNENAPYNEHFIFC